VKMLILGEMGRTAANRLNDLLKSRNFTAAYLAGIAASGAGKRNRRNTMRYLASLKAAALSPECRDLLMITARSMVETIYTIERMYHSLQNSHTYRFGRLILAPVIALNNRLRLLDR
jgi:hypothetical protein